jgi:signal transduction histidine kinase
MAYADPTQIKQVLINLGSNAGYAMREQGGTLDVIESSLDLDKEDAEKVSQGLAPGPYVQVTVQDTGYGMDEETIEHIFEPFFTTKKGEGTGMGLAVAHGIIEEHRGAITVQSRPGVGTTFSVYLPSVKDK